MTENKMPPNDFFREIGFNTSMSASGCQEEIFFLKPRMVDDSPGDNRMASVSAEAVEEFVSYWKNQIAVAEDYVKNGLNPRTHEWKQEA